MSFAAFSLIWNMGHRLGRLGRAVKRQAQSIQQLDSVALETPTITVLY
jgi:hypothetical protein